MQATDNFELKVYEGTDLFNPLTVENENVNEIDEQMFKNQNAGIQTATELFTTTVHAITRNVEDAAVFRFTAVSRFTAGDTFTVDGVQVSALTTSGEQIPDGAFIIGSEVIGVLKGTLLTLYVSMATPANAVNAQKLNGQEASYYGTAEDVEAAQETATAAGTLAAQNQTAITELNSNLSKIGTVTSKSVTTTIPQGSLTTITSSDTLQAGTYIINVDLVGSTALTAGRMVLNFNNTTVEGYGNYLGLNGTEIATFTEPTALSINAYLGGSSVSATCRIKTIRIA